MRNIHLLLAVLFLAACHPQQSAPSADGQELQEYAILDRMATTNLNFSSGIPIDSILRQTRNVEALARISGNTTQEFKAGQVQVNTYGLAGSFGLAATKAQQLLDKARMLQDPIALGLAAQAIGDTYLHSNRFAQADSVFNEAAYFLIRHGASDLQLQLMFQQLHARSNMELPHKTAQTISLIRAMLKSDPALSEQQLYDFMLTCYEAFEAIHGYDIKQASLLLDRIRREQPTDGLFVDCIYALESDYWMLAEEYEKALDYSDTALMNLRRSANVLPLCNALRLRASLLEKMGETQEACAIYPQLTRLTDSLHKQQYISQVDSMHVTFWIDHLHTENVTRRNALYTKLIAGMVILMLVTGGVILIIRRQNRRIEASRRALEAMREASTDSIRTKSLFLSNMSHELRTPLNAIMGFSSILTDEEELDEDTRHQCSGYIQQNADLLMKLISDVVDFSGLQGASIKFAFAPCDVVELCRNVVSTVDNVKRTEAQVHFQTALDKLPLNTDKNRLQQVLINLLVNATKFTKEGDITLRLSVDEVAKEAIFSVEDTGCGIPLDKQPRIFERFEKLHEGVQGAGLGLSICKLIVEHTGGRIWIDSAYTQGARFVFTHPLHFTPKNTQA